MRQRKESMSGKDSSYYSSFQTQSLNLKKEARTEKDLKESI